MKKKTAKLKKYRLNKRWIVYDVTARKYLHCVQTGSTLEYSWANTPHLFESKKKAKVILQFQTLLTTDGEKVKDNTFVVLKAYKYGI